MARKISPVVEVQSFVVEQLDEARQKLQRIEKDLVHRGRAQQKQLEAAVKRVRNNKSLKSLEKKAVSTSSQVRKRLEVAQSAVLARLGVASRSEINQIYRELTKLSKKLDVLITKKNTAALSA